MSAAHWTVCPRCFTAMQGLIESSRHAAMDSYGKVPADEYERRAEAAKKLAEKTLDPQFREDYKIGMARDGSFTVSYRGVCQRCSYDFEYVYEQVDPLATKLADQPKVVR